MTHWQLFCARIVQNVRFVQYNCQSVMSTLRIICIAQISWLNSNMLYSVQEDNERHAIWIEDNSIEVRSSN